MPARIMARRGNGNMTMTFKSIASGSSGNVYLVEEEGVAPLLIDAGIPIKTIRDKLREHGVMITDLAGCLIDHEHQDHSKSVKDLLKMGVDCWTSLGTAYAISVAEHHRMNILVSGFARKIGAFVVLPFSLAHDAAEPLGFLVAHGSDRLLFIPDTAYIENRFGDVTIIAIECNNIDEILSKNIQSGSLPAVVGRRIRRNHMSLSTVISMLRSNDLRKCRKIYLLHLSDGNSDERKMKEEVQAATGIPTEAC